MSIVDDLFDEKQLLVCAIGLRYWELQGTAKTDSKNLIQDIMKDIAPKESIVDVNSSQHNLKNLAHVLNGLLNSSTVPNNKMVLQSARLSIRDDPILFDAVKEAINEKLTEKEIDEMCTEYTRIIHLFKQRKEFLDAVKKSTTNILYSNKQFNLSEQATELIQMLQPYTVALDSQTKKVGLNSPLVVGGFNTAEPESVELAFNNAQEASSPDAVLKLGYEGMNRALGEQRGIFRGDTILVGALQHKYKSGMVCDILADIPRYNKPFFLYNKEATVPCILHISLENGVSDDLMRLYRRLYAHKYKQPLTLEDFLNLTPTQVANEIDEWLSKNGFKYLYFRLNPSNVGYLDLQNFISDIINSGYEVHVLGIDYLSMLSLKGITKTGDGTEYQELYRLMRNYCSERMIAMLTPHQLSTEATYLSRDGAGIDLPEACAGNSYYAKCKQVDREVDVEFVQHIVTKKDNNGEMKSYLVVKIGKNRRVHDVRPEHKSCALPFTDIGLIADVDAERPTFIEVSELKKAGASTMEEDSW